MSGVVLVVVYPVVMPVLFGSLQVAVPVELVVRVLYVLNIVTRAIFVGVVVKIIPAFVVLQAPGLSVLVVLPIIANHPTVVTQNLLAKARVVLLQHVKDLLQEQI
jgi:hypothetical protein